MDLFESDSLPAYARNGRATDLKIPGKKKSPQRPEKQGRRAEMKTRTDLSANGSSRLRPARKEISVLLVDDHTVIREALRSLLDSDDGINVVGEAENGRQAVDLTLELKPQILLMDIGMPRLNGLEAARQIRHLVPATRILMLTAFSSDIHIRQVVESGADGYLLKDSSANVLTTAIREVADGRKYFSVAISRRMKTLFQCLPSDRGFGTKRPMLLTARESEVLQLIAEGGANKQIAAELNISIKTVEKHRQNLMEKLKIHDTASLTRYAIASGVIDGGLLASPVAN